ncbi:MAG: hypothetical protein JSR66_17460 [Proteobacteria bacterium]|nr:hypothetical protein [Pseudomonadota bacterium]
MANLMQAYTWTSVRDRAGKAFILMLERLAWSVKGTGRLGLAGIALLVASGVFFLSTYLQLSRDTQALGLQLEDLRNTQRSVPRQAPVDTAAQLLGSLPARGDMPALLGVVLAQANAAHLTIDSGKYDESAMKAGGLVRYRVTFPLVGSYPQIRRFIDALLTAMPNVAVSDLSVQRKAIADGVVEAQVGLTVFTRERS